VAEIPNDLLYTEEHEYVKGDGDVVTIGITQFAAEELTDITYVAYKLKPGAAVAANALPTRWSFASVPVSPPRDVEADPRAADAVAQPGRPLDAGTRRSMEARFRVDLGRVRLHDDARAAAATRAAGAEALTLGDDIALETRHDPARGASRALLAHELAHVAQQRAGAVATVQRKDGPAAAPATTLEGLPEADRKTIQVVTTHVVVPDLAGKFATTGTKTTLPLPSGVAATFDASVDAALQHGLGNVAGSLSGTADFTEAPLPPNSTITLELDLGAKLGKGLFRFTYHSPAPPAGKQSPAAAPRILVEALGKATAPPGTKAPPPPAKEGAAPAPDPVAEKIKNNSLSHSYTGAELDAFRAALAQAPNAQLALVSGLTFARDAAKTGDPDASGDYDPKTHTITMFDRAFSATEARVTRAGGVASSSATRAIVHEIGHAIDLAPLRKAGEEKDKADAAVAALSSKYPDPDDPTAYKYPTGGPEEKDVKAVLQAQKDKETGLLTARSRSGTKTIKKPDGTFDEEIGTAAKGNAFREAAVKDAGKAVTKYGEQDWQEAYAEAYSLFITSPETLKALRPNVYAHLDSTLPK
jgi:hypothetical protein